MLKNDQDSGVPSCFGKHYDGTSPECIGGPDPTHYNSRTGTRVRDTCDYVQQCAIRSQANKSGPTLIPSSSLVRPAYKTPFTPPQPQPYSPPRQYGAPQQYGGPQHSANVQQMIAVNYAMPQYLTVREPSNGGQMFRRLAIEAARSIGKSLGHTIAHFFDVEVFGPRDGNQNGG